MQRGPRGLPASVQANSRPRHRRRHMVPRRSRPFQTRLEGHTHFGRRPPTDQSNSGDFSSYLEKVPGTWCTSCYPGRHLGPSLVTLFGPIPGSIAQATIARYQAASAGRASLTSSRDYGTNTQNKRKTEKQQGAYTKTCQ